MNYAGDKWFCTMIPRIKSVYGLFAQVQVVVVKAKDDIGFVFKNGFEVKI